MHAVILEKKAKLHLLCELHLGIISSGYSNVVAIFSAGTLLTGRSFCFVS